MESLSTELCDEVASYLSTTDLRALRLVNRQFSAVATRPLFAVLRFGSHRQDKFYFNWGPYWEHQGYPGRIRTVEFGSVPEAVVDIMASSLEQHAKAFIFDPAYYRKDFWRDYRAWIKATVQNYWDEEHVSDEDFMSETEEDPPRSVQRQQWRTRIAREAPAVKRAHTVWGVKSLHQEASMDDIIDALTKMFKEMNCLYSLDVRSPMFRGYPGLDSFFSFDIDKSTLHNKPCNFPSSNYVNMLAMALRGAGRHISELRISLACVPELENNLSNAHLFTGLQQLELDMIEDDSFFTSSRRLESFCSLMLFAAPTLQSLALYHPMARPYMRERSLLKLLSIDANESPIVFPQLKFLRLRSSMLSTPALLRFLRAQPKLECVDFWSIYLGLCPDTDDAAWPYLAKSLPDTVKSWRISPVAGHEVVEPATSLDEPVAVHRISEWDPLTLPPDAGWTVQKLSSGKGDTHARKTAQSGFEIVRDSSARLDTYNTFEGLGAHHKDRLRGLLRLLDHLFLDYLSKSQATVSTAGQPWLSEMESLAFRAKGRAKQPSLRPHEYDEVLELMEQLVEGFRRRPVDNMDIDG